MNTNTAKKILTATTATICISAPWAGPAHATTDHGGGGSAVWAEPDPGQLIAQRKARAAHAFVAYAAPRAEYAVLQRRTEHRSANGVLVASPQQAGIGSASLRCQWTVAELPHSPDAVEGWFRRCPPSTLPHSPTGVEGWTR